MIGIRYWDNRLHRWGAWLATGGGRLSSTPLARMRELGVRVDDAGQQDTPMVHVVEQETDAMIRNLQPRTVGVIDAYYRNQDTINDLAQRFDMHPDTIRAWIRDSHKRLQRQLEERRRGEPRQKPSKAVTVLGAEKRGRGRTVASVVPENTIS